MFAPYEMIEWKKSKVDKELILSKNWFLIIKENNINKLYLEDFPNNCLIENIKDFKILEKWEKNTILKVFIDKSYIILDITNTQKEIIKKFENTNKNWKWWYEEVKKNKNEIIYYIYTENKIKKCESNYIEGENNTIWQSSWEYTKDKLHIKKKYFPITTKEKLLNLFRKKD